MKRTMLATIVFLLLTSLAFGAGANEGSSADADGMSALINMKSLLPVTTELVNPSMIMKWQGDQSTPEDMYIFKWFEKVCNIKFDVTPINNADFDAKYNIILNAGDLPDVTTAFMSPSIMSQYFSAAGLGFDMWPSIVKYAPDMKLYFDNDPDVKAMCSVDGKLLSLAQYRYVGFAGGRDWIRRDFLEAVGMDMPKTLDEFKETLVAFRDKDPNGNGEADEIGFGGSWEEGYRDWDPIQAVP
jgi:putative aldouronate transport system substrate-binding protein